MATRTRIVAWLRVILPLAALALLSSLFLLARRPAPAPDIALPPAEPHIGAPSWAGVTRDGARLSLRAGSLVPQGERSGTAETVELDWNSPEGLRLRLRAARARIGQDITLDGGIEADTSTGWRLRAPALTAATDASRLSASQVSARAPFGEITAGAMELAREGDHHVLNFKDGVRLIYRPGP